MSARRGMGRGLAAILPEPEAGEAELRELPIDVIVPNPDQPRRRFDPATISALAGSLSDSLRHRWGRRHPFIYASALPLALSFIGVFRPPGGLGTLGLFCWLTVFAVHHGSSPKFNIPEAVGDVRRATRFIKMKSEELGVDPDRLGVWGGSAGGHLSLVLGTTSDEGDPDAAEEVLRWSSRLAAVVALYPPIDLRGLNRRAMDPDADPPADPRFKPALTFDTELAASASPILHVSSDDPPTLLIHGDKDGLVPVTTSKTIHAAFVEKNVTTDIIIIEGADHGFRGADRTRSLEAAADWFARHLSASTK